MNNTSTAFSLLNVGKSYFKGRDYENSNRCLTVACSIFEQLYGKVNLYSANCFIFMAQIAYFQSNHRPALEFYNTSYQIYSNLIGNEHEHCLRLLLNIIHLSGILGEMEQLHKAKLKLEELAIKAVESFLYYLGKIHLFLKIKLFCFFKKSKILKVLFY